MTSQTAGVETPDANLQGKRALIICTDFGVEEAELVGPLEALRSAGADVTVASTTGQTIQTVNGDKDWASTIEPSGTVESMSVDDFDVLIAPGGTVNADTLRGNEDVQQLLRAFVEAKKPVAAICHAPWILIDAGLADGKNLTSYQSLKPDLVNAGAQWNDRSLVRCDGNGWVLITSRNPGDLDDFNAAIAAELAA